MSSKYSYVAINNEYQKVTGIISAEDVDGAKAELHKMGLSVLKIQEDLSPEFKTVDDTIQNFWFFVRDSKGQEASGTIEAQDRKNAYRRLVSEYKFEVLSLCAFSVPSEQRREEGAKGLKELEEEVMFEFGVVPIHQQEQHSEKEEVEKITSQSFFEQRKQIQDEVDSVTSKAEEILEKYKEKISDEEYRSIERSKDTLMRMKLSTNISYIKQLSEELFDSIHTVILKYEGQVIDDGISDMGDGDEQVEDLVEQVRSQSLENVSTLGQLKYISKRLNTVLKKRQVISQKQKEEKRRKQKQKEEKSQSRTYFKNMLSSLKRAMTTKSHAIRIQKWNEFKENFNHWRNLKEKIKKEKEEMKVRAEEEEILHEMSSVNTFTLLLREVRILTGWLLGFFTFFFFFALFAFEKGFTPVLPYLKTILDTPFLVFFAAFLFILSLTISIWHHFRGKYILLTIGTFGSLSLFLLFVFNY